MKWYSHKIPAIVSKSISSVIWSFDTSEKTIFLTFDDGPQPEVTRFVLDQLKEYNSNATFFQIGNNIQKYPNLAEDVINAGHSIGNHTHTHLNGWQTNKTNYLRDVMACDSQFRKLGIDTILFRPPFGKITPGQIKALSTHSVIMWDYISGDFDPKLNLEIARKSLSNCGPGSIVVFHDNLRFMENLRILLPWFLREFSDRGYTFESIPMTNPKDD